MQTFVPHGPDFEANAASLDNKRLGKQRVEGIQILNTLIGNSSGWKNHPAVKMWRGYEHALGWYTVRICDRWISLGYKDTCREKVFSILGGFPHMFMLPQWLYDKDLQTSHKSNLIRKFPEHYGKLWPTIPNDLPYKWPV